MESKEALKDILDILMNFEHIYAIDDTHGVKKQKFEIIEKDLDRLEKLEKENQELKEKCRMLEENEEAVLTTLEISVQENTRLKKVIEIFRKMCSLNNNKTLETEECFLRLTEEEYELLKEVFGNE